MGGWWALHFEGSLKEKQVWASGEESTLGHADFQWIWDMGGRLSRRQVAMSAGTPESGLAEALGVVSLGPGGGRRRGRGPVCQEKHGAWEGPRLRAEPENHETSPQEGTLYCKGPLLVLG